MAAYIAIILSLLSIILMIVILVKFKKLFSTEAIIEKTKNQMNRVIMDVNNNANRDIELINDSTRRLRALLNDADKKMENFREATQLLRETIAEAEKAGVKKKVNLYVDPDASYKVRNIPAKENQRSLFDDEEEEKPKTILKDETLVTKDGAAYKEVPLIITKVYDDKLSAVQKPQTSLRDKVEKLFAQGMQVDDIAAELSCSTSEVQFIIDMHV